MAGKKKRKSYKRKPLDAKDKQVGDLLTINPRMGIVRISEILGIPQTTVWRRIKKIQSSDLVTEYSGKIEEVFPLAFAVLIRKLLQGDYGAARDVFYGRGALSNKHKHEHSGKIDHGMGADPLFAGMDADEIDAMREACRNRIRAIENPPPALGKDVPPDGEKRAD